jgi:hypothetical protein
MRLSLWERSEIPDEEPTEVPQDSPFRKAVTCALLVALDFLGRQHSRADLVKIGWMLRRSGRFTNPPMTLSCHAG